MCALPTKTWFIGIITPVLRFCQHTFYQSQKSLSRQNWGGSGWEAEINVMAEENKTMEATIWTRLDACSNP